MLSEDDSDNHFGLDAEVASSRRTIGEGPGSEPKQSDHEDRDPSQLSSDTSSEYNISKTEPFTKRYSAGFSRMANTQSSLLPQPRGEQHQSPFGKDCNGSKPSPFSELSEVERGKGSKSAQESCPHCPLRSWRELASRARMKRRIPTRRALTSV